MAKEKADKVITRCSEALGKSGAEASAETYGIYK